MTLVIPLSLCLNSWDDEPLGRDLGSAFVPFRLAGKLWLGPAPVSSPSARCHGNSTMAAVFGYVLSGGVLLKHILKLHLWMRPTLEKSCAHSLWRGHEASRLHLGATGSPSHLCFCSRLLTSSQTPVVLQVCIRTLTVSL